MQKKILILAVIVMLSANLSVYGSGTPVFDITNWLQAIDNALTMIDQLEVNIQNVKNTYNQLEKTAKALKGYDFDEFLQSGNFREKFKRSLSSTINYTNKKENLQRRMENLVNAKNIKVGNLSYSINDLIRSPVQSIKSFGVDEAAFVVADPFRMTPNDKMAFYAKYGLEPRNYRRMQDIGKVIGETIFPEAIAKAEARRQLRSEELATGAAAFVEAALASESVMELSQIGAAQREQMVQALQDIEEASYKKTELLGWHFAYLDAQKKAGEIQRVGNHAFLEKDVERFLRRINKNLKDEGYKDPMARGSKPTGLPAVTARGRQRHDSGRQKWLDFQASLN